MSIIKKLKSLDHLSAKDVSLYVGVNCKYIVFKIFK